MAKSASYARVSFCDEKPMIFAIYTCIILFNCLNRYIAKRFFNREKNNIKKFRVNDLSHDYHMKNCAPKFAIDVMPDTSEASQVIFMCE